MCLHVQVLLSPAATRPPVQPLQLKSRAVSTAPPPAAVHTGNTALSLAQMSSVQPRLAPGGHQRPLVLPRHLKVLEEARVGLRRAQRSTACMSPCFSYFPSTAPGMLRHAPAQQQHEAAFGVPPISHMRPVVGHAVPCLASTQGRACKKRCHAHTLPGKREAGGKRHASGRTWITAGACSCSIPDRPSTAPGLAYAASRGASDSNGPCRQRAAGRRAGA